MSEYWGVGILSIKVSEYGGVGLLGCQNTGLSDWAALGCISIWSVVDIWSVGFKDLEHNVSTRQSWDHSGIIP